MNIYSYIKLYDPNKLCVNYLLPYFEKQLFGLNFIKFHSFFTTGMIVLLNDSSIKSKVKVMDDTYNRDILDEETLFQVSQIFKALSEPTRIRIMFLLNQKECSVNEIAEYLGLLQSTVSHQLRFLRNLRLVKFRREGTTIYYSAHDQHVYKVMEQTIEHARHN